MQITISTSPPTPYTRARRPAGLILTECGVPPSPKARPSGRRRRTSPLALKSRQNLRAAAAVHLLLSMLGRSRAPVETVTEPRSPGGRRNNPELSRRAPGLVSLPPRGSGSYRGRDLSLTLEFPKTPLGNNLRLSGGACSQDAEDRISSPVHLKGPGYSGLKATGGVFFKKKI